MKTDSDPMGWRMAALTVVLALALTGAAYTIHTKVYCDPAHPSCVKVPAAASHDAPHDAGHAAPAVHATPDTGHGAPAKAADTANHKMVGGKAGDHLIKGGE